MQQYVLQYVQQRRRLILQVVLFIVLLLSRENATKFTDPAVDCQDPASNPLAILDSQP